MPRRVLFGLLDADGWGWAGVRSVLWTLVIILLLGYIPDRAYYLTVSPTVDLGLNMASLVNICPAENEGLPCPAPAGALIPWKSATEADVGATLRQVDVGQWRGIRGKHSHPIVPLAHAPTGPQVAVHIAAKTIRRAFGGSGHEQTAVAHLPAIV